MSMLRIIASLFVSSLLFGASIANAQPSVSAAAATTPATAWKFPTPLGLDDVMTTAPEDNLMTEAKVTLGKSLFWDKRMSPAGTHACLSCHLPHLGWTDGLVVSTKADGKANTRHSPTLYNVAYNTSYYWDGRAPTLEKQVQAAWEGQMGAKDKTADIAKKLAEIPGYKKLFDEAFGEGDVTVEKIVKATSTFVRTILSGDSAWDKFQAGDKAAMTDGAKRGWDLVKGKARCGTCHAPGLFTNYGFHNLGVGMTSPSPDVGRAKPTNEPGYNGAFKTPTLRNVLSHPPYTHNGDFKSIEELLLYFQKPNDNPNLDPQFKGGIPLTEAERTDLVEFLKALGSTDRPETAKAPKLP